MATAKAGVAGSGSGAQEAEVKLVFYDLEWTQNEIIQIGAVCGNQDFSQSIRPSGKIDPFVRKKVGALKNGIEFNFHIIYAQIKLDVRKDPTGQWQVYDLVRKRFLPTVGPREGFERFLAWLEEISDGHRVYMVSHGNSDILVLDRNFARFDLDARLYQVVSKYIDFQKYLVLNFKDISRLSLLELVKIFCNNQIFRLHCADEDSKALMSVFNNMHQMRGIPAVEYMKNIDKLKKVYIKSVTIPKNSKEIKDIANHLNPGSKYVLLPSIFGVYNIFVSSPLFKIIEHPENFKFEVSGYCVGHRSEKCPVRNFNSKKDDESKERTRIDLACHIGNAYFILTHYIQSGAKSNFNLVRKETGTSKKIVLDSGTPVSVMILVTSTNYVKVDDISVNYDKKLVDINRILTDLQKKQGSQKEDSWGSVNSSVSSNVSTSSGSEGNKPKTVNQINNNNGFKNADKSSKYVNKGGHFQHSNEVETDSTILTRRQKQIEYCKRTDDYKVYVKEVPKQSRCYSMPKTPDMNRKYSRRQWDGAVKRWKTQVHATGRDLVKNQSASSSGQNSSPKENTNPNSNQ